jgi:hypothetical protein
MFYNTDMYVHADSPNRTYNEDIEIHPVEVEGPPVEYIDEQHTQADRIPVNEALVRPGRLNEWFREAVLPKLPAHVRRVLPGLTLRGDRIPVSFRAQFWHFDLPNGQWNDQSQGLFVVGSDSETDVARPFEASVDPHAAIKAFTERPDAVDFVSAPPLHLIWSPRGPFVHRRGRSPSGLGSRYAYDIAKVYSKK